MADVEYTIERRAKLLSDAIQRRKNLYIQALAPAGQRPPFTKQLSTKEAVSWWREHRYDDLGKKLLSNMKPESIMELDNALSQANEADGIGDTNYQY